MVYRVIGLMSGSSLDGLDIVFAELQEKSGKWSYEVRAAATYPYENGWVNKLNDAIRLSARDYLLLHTAFGHYCGELVNRFVAEFQLQYQAQLVVSHGHTTFHAPSAKMTGQLGDGAAIAAVTGINVVSDLRAMDIALGGHGAPIVPIGERLLLNEYPLFLNLGGIANISFNGEDKHVGFDVCPANRVLNMLIQHEGKPYDEGGALAATGKIIPSLLELLNGLEYYSMNYPKSLSNDFGTDVLYPLVRDATHNTADGLRTYTEHIAIQISKSLTVLKSSFPTAEGKCCITGGGAHNHFLTERIRELVGHTGVEAIVPGHPLVDFKEALIMALIGVLRWREENNVLASVTGASRDSIGGAVWIGQEA
jgi:anhydro-N-acetylmuramic acid kinase